MLFNSFEFAIFFPVVTYIYFALRGEARIWWLLAASVCFYAVLIPAYTLILAAMILVDYAAGRMIEEAGTAMRKRLFLGLSLASNIGLLGVFKYFDFVAANLAAWLGRPMPMLEWALPLGLSFHTFQAVSYTIEVYRGRYPAERSLRHFALYVMFYPQLVAGPIERPQNLLRQLHQRQTFSPEALRAGLVLMFWGLFKKAAIADRLSFLSDAIFSNYGHAPAGVRGPLVALGALCFGFQIYCDFSGYSDIAFGAAQVMGFSITRNFRQPYFATSFRDFWRRWHVSLSSWFRDYVYIPLGGNRGGPLRTALAIVVVFLLSGLWHGANWTFLAWGALHALYRMAEAVVERFVRFQSAALGLVRGVFVFCAVTYAWIFFRAPSIGSALSMTAALGEGWGSLLHPVRWLETVAPDYGGWSNFNMAAGLIALLLAVDWGIATESLVPWFESRPGWQRGLAYNAAFLALYLTWARDEQKFLYFQF